MVAAAVQKGEGQFFSGNGGEEDKKANYRTTYGGCCEKRRKLDVAAAVRHRLDKENNPYKKYHFLK